MRVPSIVAICLLLMISLLLGYANASTVDFDYLLGHIHIHLMLLLSLMFVLGCLLTSLLYSTRLMKQRHKCRQMQREIYSFQQELKTLRCSPLKDKQL